MSRSQKMETELKLTINKLQMNSSIQADDPFLNLYGLTPLWDTYYEKTQNVKFKNKWQNVKDGWRPRKK